MSASVVPMASTADPHLSMSAAVVPMASRADYLLRKRHGWQDAGPGQREYLEAKARHGESCWRRKVERIFSALDLRFKGNGSAEDAFVQSLEAEVLKHGFLICLVGAILIPLALVPALLRESRNTRTPLEFQNWDVRHFVFLVWISVFVLTASYCVASFMRMWKNWFQRWDWELLFLTVATYYIIALSLANFWHLPFVAGGHPSQVWQQDARGTEFLILLAIVVILTAVAMYVPIRTCKLWTLHVCGIGCYSVMLVAFETILPNARHLTTGALVLLAFFALHGAFQYERQRRQQWQALGLAQKTDAVVLEQTTYIQDASALLRGLQNVATNLCDFLIYLTADLKIQNSDKTHKAFFEQDIEGMEFVDLLQESDAPRFKTFVELVSNSHIPACLPVTVRRSCTTSTCHVLVVDMGAREPRYLMGVRVEKEDIHSPRPSIGLFQVWNEPANQPIQADDLFLQDDSAEAAAPVSSGSAILRQTLGLMAAVRPGGDPVASWTSSAAQDSDISFTTFPKRDPPTPPRLTPIPSRASALGKLLSRWNVARARVACCPFHTTLRSIPEVLGYLEAQQCQALWSTHPVQCPRCLSMCPESSRMCAVCSFASPVVFRGSDT